MSGTDRSKQGTTAMMTKLDLFTSPSAFPDPRRLGVPELDNRL
jgi:hypothetical protein